MKFAVVIAALILVLFSIPVYADGPGDVAGAVECEENFVAPAGYVYQYSGSDCAHNDQSDYSTQSNETGDDEPGER